MHCTFSGDWLDNMDLLTGIQAVAGVETPATFVKT